MDEMNNVAMLDALDKIHTEAKNSKLSYGFWNTVSDEVEFLSERLGLRELQVVVVAILAEKGRAMSWRQLAGFLGLSRLKFMSYSKDIDDLVEKGWLRSCAAEEEVNILYEGIALMRGVVTALRKGEKFVPEKLDDLSIQQFVDRMVLYCTTEVNDHHISGSENCRWLMQLCRLNSHLPLAKRILSLPDEVESIAFILAVVDYARGGGKYGVEEGMSIDELSGLIELDWKINQLERNLQSGESTLLRDKLLEYVFAEGMMDCSAYKVSEYTRTVLLEGYETMKSSNRQIYSRNVTLADSIKKRELFFNPDTDAQFRRLAAMLEENRLKDIFGRLESRELRKGIACLFYGAPGTGKTEGAYQLARLSGRDIMAVDIAGMRDKYVGESERNIKAIFDAYRDLCAVREQTPILLFNEADAIIGTRFEKVRTSVEKMDNAMQNIILQEMEKFEGILIATTNLTGNIDHAFDRRFLFKVEFSKPLAATRQKIWRSLLPDRKESVLASVADRFDLSGGQIENVARKSDIEYILEGDSPSLSRLEEMCREEMINRNPATTIGFVRKNDR